MEAELIDFLRRKLPPHPALRVGIGDDAAVLRLGEGSECVVTTDVITDQVDFHVDQIDPRRIGHKALAVNLSDLAAMAARPLAAVVGVVLPRARGMDLAVGLVEGMLPLAERYHVALAGGDTNSWDGPLVVSVTALGTVPDHGVWLRNGARPGDAVLVTGSFGGSILGKHLDFEPRVAEALRIAGRYPIRAAIDVSDGLSLDLSRVAAASGCGIEIRLEDIPISDAARQLAAQPAAQPNSPRTPLDHALGDGEDFELILIADPAIADRLTVDNTLGVPITCIGRCINEPGLWQIDATNTRTPLPPRGFWHHFDGPSPAR